MAASKVVTVRINPEEAHRAEFVARADDMSVNEVFRRALVHYVEWRKTDPEFVARAKAMVARDAEIAGGMQ